MRYENHERLPWENVEEEIQFHEKNDVMQEANKLGWEETEKLTNESENMFVSSTTQSTMHFKNKAVPKGDAVTSIALHIKDEVVKHVKKHVEDKAKRKEEESKKKEENHGSPILLALAGIVFAFIFLLVTPIVILFNEVASQEPKIVAAAKAELSVAEENIGGIKYKEWYGINGNWCAMFVSYCSNECEFIAEDIMPKSASVMNMSQWYKDRGQWEDAEGYIPKAGDIIFFQNEMSHVGIVIDYDKERHIITTIEGNTGPAVTTLEHSHLWESTICMSCGGAGSLAETCATCLGKGYYNEHGDMFCWQYGCPDCGGSGYNAYGSYGFVCPGEGKDHGWPFLNSSFKLGSGKSSENISCTQCYASGMNKGLVVRCANPGCSKNTYGTWEDYPEGVCYTTTCEYHEASRVMEKKYPITYRKITGYGLPYYYENWFEELFSGE